LNTLQKPPRLPAGGTIGVAAISGAVEPEALEKGIAYLLGRGYRLVEAPNLRFRQGDFAGTDRQRAEGYRDLVRNPDVQAVFFARGGWGAARIFDNLDAAEIASFPKIHMGGSDLTSLFGFLQNRAGLTCFHGPMVAVDFARRPVDAETDESWERMLRGEAPMRYSLSQQQVVQEGGGRGRLVGGCLSILVSLEGTREAVDAEGKVLFWEDAGEEIYRLDRMLTQLRRAGKLERLAGVIIGKLEAITRKGVKDETAVSELLQGHFGKADYPVLRDWPAGHAGSNRTMALGANMTIDTAAGFVEIEEAGVL
jgi:muramoyltetrapeptide carboxypeptidase